MFTESLCIRSTKRDVQTEIDGHAPRSRGKGVPDGRRGGVMVETRASGRRREDASRGRVFRALWDADRLLIKLGLLPLPLLFLFTCE